MEQITKHKFCISVDGSIFSDYGFDFTVNDLYKSGDEITLVHVINKKKLDDIPFNFKPEVIMSKYETQLIGKFPKSCWKIVQLDKRDEVQHALQQVYTLCQQDWNNVLVVGHSGHKSSKVSMDVTKGINFILNYMKIPTFIMRESLSRKSKPSFTWMICMTALGSRSYKAFEFAIPFIHPDDKVIALHVKKDNESADSLRENFEAICKARNFKNFKFDERKKTDCFEKIGKTIANFVNFSDEFVDILVVGKNSSKYDSIEDLPAYEIIKNSEANFLFYS
jgi:hypothetical protein